MKRRQKKENSFEPAAAAPEPVEEAMLSPYRAFVVQFREAIQTAPEHFAGRVEHMISGQAVRFYSPEELTAFLRRMLSDMDGRDSRDE